MTTATAGSRLERQLGDLTHLHGAPILTTCYLDVDGALRSRRADWLTAFGVLAQQARQRAEIEEPAFRVALDGDLAMFERWLEETFDRSRTRGLVLLACSGDSWFRAVELPVRVRDQIVVAERPHLLQLEAIVAHATRFGVALVDHEKMRVFEHRLGELSEYPALFEGFAPQRERQHGWNVSSSPSASGDAAAQWAPVGTHVDRREVELAERHLVRCAAALSEHLDRHPVDHLLLGGPAPERTRLERHLSDRDRSRIAGHVSVRVNAPLTEIREVIASIVPDIEKNDEIAILNELETAFGEGSALLGLRAVLAALSEGRVQRLYLSTGLQSQPGTQCTSCDALSVSQGACDVCGAPTALVDDIVEAAVERAIKTGSPCSFIHADQVATAADGAAATTRY